MQKMVRVVFYYYINNNKLIFQAFFAGRKVLNVTKSHVTKSRLQAEHLAHQWLRENAPTAAENGSKSIGDIWRQANNVVPLQHHRGSEDAGLNSRRPWS